jgi:hypothetical protein
MALLDSLIALLKRSPGKTTVVLSDDLGDAVVLGSSEATRPEAPGLIFVAEPGKIVPPDGKERDITLADLEAMVRNCDTEISRGKTDPFAIDIDHATIRKTGKESGAIGFGRKLVLKDGMLWADPNFNGPDDEALVTGKKFRFTSPVIQFKHKDFKTGENVGARLHSLAITNQPISPGARPMLAASEFLGKEKTMKMIKVTIGETEFEVPEAVAEALKAKPADDTEATEALKASEAKAKELQEALALSEAKNPAEDAVVLSAQEWTETKAKAERGDQAAVTLEAMKVTGRVKDLIREGRITAAEAKEDKIVKAVANDETYALMLSMRAPNSAWPADGLKGGDSRPADGSEDPRVRLDKVVKDLIASEAKTGTIVSYADALTRVQRDPAQKATVEAAV